MGIKAGKRKKKRDVKHDTLLESLMQTIAFRLKDPPHPLGWAHISNCLLLDRRHFYEWEEFRKLVREGEIIIEAGQLLRAAQQPRGVKKNNKTKDRKLKTTIREVYFISL